VANVGDTSIPALGKTGNAPIVNVGQTHSTRFGHEAGAKTNNPGPTATTVIPGAPTTTQ
jgi:hypothetical protein